MKRERIFYTPGLISIVGLPVLLLFFWPKEPVTLTCLKVFLPTDRKDDPGVIRFSKEMVYKSLKGKKIVTIDLDVERFNAEDNKTQFGFYKKLHFVTQEIERLEFTNDTSTVLKVQLGANNTYGDYVWVLNQLFLYKVRRYAFADNSFYVYADLPIDHTSQVVEPILYGDDYSVVVTKPVLSKWDVFKSKVKQRLRDGFLIIKYNYVCVIGFVLLILLPATIKIRSGLGSYTMRIK